LSSLEISQVLSQMRALQARASGGSAETAESAPVTGEPSAFANMIKSQIDGVASLQNNATALANAYEAGDKSADLTKVMLEVQKAGLAFHAMTEVRNKLIDAYTQVMNMPV